VGASRVKEAGKIAGSQLISVQADVNVRVIDINTGKTADRRARSTALTRTSTPRAAR
jgi:hypothetical protein